MTYIDFDGVILDTEILLFENWRKNPDRHLLSENKKIEYIQNENWNYIVNNALEINDSIYNLKQMNPNTTFILTKIHSMENEGKAKIEWVKKNGIKIGIILVPFYFKKTEIVDANRNILIDDCLKNLYEWEENNGVPIFFDMDDDDYDSWNKPNIKGYEKVKSLSKFRQ